MLILVFLILIITIVYNVYDNNRIAVVTEKVVIKNLPESFNNFTILQLSDLHGKRFGQNQKDLIDKINSQSYDMIAITGDMQDMSSQNDEPLLEMLDSIINKEDLFYVSGNHGPKYSEKLQSKGCIPLDKPYEIKRGNNSIWVHDFYDGKFHSDIKYIDNEDIKIAVTHYPFDEAFYSTSSDTIGEYDLVLAGHYHGGQVRIPFYGAVFIPDINGNNLFPKQNVVSGLNTYGRYNQYVSRGLGASKEGIIDFRLFNTPEINLITLVKE